MKLVARDRIISLESPIIMGVVNVSPDSFSGDGLEDAALSVTLGAQMMLDGATIIDVGGESSRPGSLAVSASEELKRVLPVVIGLARQTNAVISVDTAKSEVAEEVLKAGAHIINDITGLRDARMAGIVAKYNAGLVIMHMQGLPRTMQKNPHYTDVVSEVSEFFRERIARAAEAGITNDHIVLDPGIGFGKNLEHNTALLKAVPDFLRAFDHPLLIGASRKSFIGKLTGREATSDRIFGTVAVTALAVRDGAQILRVHDVSANHDAMAVAVALKRG